VTARSKLKIGRALTKKGFVEDRARTHIRFTLCVDDIDEHLSTLYSHSNYDCDDALLGLMAKQLRLTKQQFLDLVDCSLDQEGYVKILKEQGAV